MKERRVRGPSRSPSSGASRRSRSARSSGAFGSPAGKPGEEWVAATFDTVFEGQGLLVVSKPAGLPTHRTSDARRPNLFDALRAAHPGVSLLHRLDADTSGVMLFTLDADWNPRLASLFEHGGIEKTYLAVVSNAHGMRECWTTESLIARARRRQNVYHSVSPEEAAHHDTARPARTLFRLRAAVGPLALVEARPITGRPHQIRVHLADEGLPIVGDRIYGGRLAPRLMLHAWTLTFNDPPTGKQWRFEAPIPPEIAQVAHVPQHVKVERGRSAAPHVSARRPGSARRGSAGR